MRISINLINYKYNRFSRFSYNINKSIVENVQNGDYILHGMDSVENFRDTVIAGLMDLPLESVELGKDILALLGSPYMSKRATSPEQIGKSRMEMLIEHNPHLLAEYETLYNRTTNLYGGVMYDFAEAVLKNVNKKLPEDLKLFLPNGDTSAYGKYVIPLLTSEIASTSYAPQFQAVLENVVGEKISLYYLNTETEYDFGLEEFSDTQVIYSCLYNIVTRSDEEHSIVVKYTAEKNGDTFAVTSIEAGELDE